MFTVTDKYDNETAKQYAMRMLVDNIVLLNLKPGEKLSEVELCEYCGVSRTPIREAILELNQKNLIDIFPKRGTYVSLIDVDTIYDFIEFRTVIEGKLSQIACDIVTPAHIERMREIMALWQYHASVHNIKKMHYYDKEFHRYVYDACNKQYWYQIVNSHMFQYDRIIALCSGPETSDTIYTDHNHIIDALEAKDYEAAYNVVIDHVARFKDLYERLRQQHPEYFKS